MDARLHQIAGLVGGTVVHTGGNFFAVKVVDPNFARQEFVVGLDSGGGPGYDRTIDGEHMSSGDLHAAEDADAGTIAAEIKKLMKMGRDY